MRNDVQADNAEKTVAPSNNQSIESEKMTMYQCPQGFIVNNPAQCREDSFNANQQFKLPKLELS